MNAPPRIRCRQPAGLALLLLAGLLNAGCAQWSYERIEIGQPLRDYERVFPEEDSRKTRRSLCLLKQDALGRTDAVVLLYNRLQVVYAKFQATARGRDAILAAGAAYTVRGTIDPAAGGFRDVGPIDLLRAVADDLTADDHEAAVRDAHAWVAAGLTRIIQQWPGVSDPGPAYPRLTRTLASVSADGTATVTVGPQRRLHVSYIHPAADR